MSWKRVLGVHKDGLNFIGPSRKEKLECIYADDNRGKLCKRKVEWIVWESGEDNYACNYHKMVIEDSGTLYAEYERI